MVKVGDRIGLSSSKGPDRAGVVTAVTGALIRVRWSSGDETMVAPAPGTLSVLAAGRAAPRKGAKKSVAKKSVAKKSVAKKTAGATKKIASKSGPPEKSGATKTRGS